MSDLFESPFDSALKLVQALNIAAENSLMSRDHAGVLWKHWLKQLGLDVPKSPIDTVNKLTFDKREVM